MTAARVLRNAALTAVCGLIALLVGFVVYGNFLQGKPDVTVQHFGQTPRSVGEEIHGVLPQHKLDRYYAYRYTYNNGGLLFPKVDHDEYLADHPDDAVIESFYQGVGLEVTVYSSSLPDDRYFRISGPVRAHQERREYYFDETRRRQ